MLAFYLAKVGSIADLVIDYLYAFFRMRPPEYQ